MSEADDSHVWLLIEDKATVMGVYANEDDANTDAELMGARYRSELLGARYRAERWAIDFSPQCPEPTDP